MNIKPLQIGNKIAKLPLIQGGMGVGVSLSRLAGAVAKAGGVGIISTAQIGFEEPDFAEDSKTANLRAMRQELEKARTIARDVDGKCPGLVGFNIMVATRDYEDYVRTAADAGADVIISGAGLTAYPIILVATVAMIMPRIIPRIPPTIQITMDSVMNCNRMEPLVAPRAFLVPISLVRSVMDTSMMFMTPIPPTSREMPPIAAIAREMVDNMEVMLSTIDSMLMALISKLSLS